MGQSSQTPPKPAVAAPQTVSHMLGEIVWLMTQSPPHRHFSLADLEWMVMPPLLLQQFRVFHENGRPVGVALWAFLSEETEAKLSLIPPRLRPDEWRSGDRCWLVDLIAPFATAENHLAGNMLANLQQTALVGKLINLHTVNTKTGKRNQVEVPTK